MKNRLHKTYTILIPEMSDLYTLVSYTIISAIMFLTLAGVTNAVMQLLRYFGYV